ncbi:MAG: SpoIIE family protein phosphatase [Fibrobacter sp.]|nr:SpoIIE family protein phosphatase [Fibrobacter sp.]
MNFSRITRLQGIGVIVAAAVVLELAAVVQYVSMRNAISSQVEEMAQRDLKATNRIVEVKRVAEDAIAGVLPEVERLLALGQEDSLHRALRRVVSEHPEIVGVDFAHRVGEDGVRNGYFTFVNEETGNIADTVIGFDYTERSWYRDGIVSDGFWSEPYMSRYYVILMSTYSRAVRDKNGNAVAVIGADIPMHELSSLSVQLYENQQRALLPVVAFQLFGLLLLGIIVYRSIRSARRLNAVNAEKEFMNRELDIASRIQLAMLPGKFFTDDCLEIAGSLVPAKQVGGDLYDYVIRDGKLFFSIGDVCGKGIPAAIFMSMTQAVFRSAASHLNDASRIVHSMNKQASRGNDAGMFVTLFVGVLDLSTGMLRYCNAGHEHPLVVTGKSVRTLNAKSSLPIGAMEETRYVEQETQLAPGDMVMLFTDGLTEAMNSENALFGRERVAQVISGETPQQLLDNMSQSVAGFVRGAEQSDDLTMLAIRYKGAAR